MAALPAEWNVGIESERCAGGGWPVQCGLKLRKVLGCPEGERRIVGDEVIARGGLLLDRRAGGLGRWGDGYGAAGGIDVAEIDGVVAFGGVKQVISEGSVVQTFE